MLRLPPVYSRLSLERRRSKRRVGSSEATTWLFLLAFRFLVNARGIPVLRGAVVVAGPAPALVLGLAADEGAEPLIQCHTETIAITSSTTMAPSLVRFSAPSFTSLPSLIVSCFGNCQPALGSALPSGANRFPDSSPG